MLTEKEAGITFCLIEGRADYAGFISKDPTLLNWAKDFSPYYGEKGKRIPHL